MNGCGRWASFQYHLPLTFQPKHTHTLSLSLLAPPTPYPIPPPTLPSTSSNASTPLSPVPLSSHERVAVVWCRLRNHLSNQRATPHPLSPSSSLPLPLSSSLPSTVLSLHPLRPPFLSLPRPPPPPPLLSLPTSVRLECVHSCEKMHANIPFTSTNNTSTFSFSFSCPSDSFSLSFGRLPLVIYPLSSLSPPSTVSLPYLHRISTSISTVQPLTRLFSLTCSFLAATHSLLCSFSARSLLVLCSLLSCLYSFARSCLHSFLGSFLARSWLVHILVLAR